MANPPSPNYPRGLWMSPYIVLASRNRLHTCTISFKKTIQKFQLFSFYIIRLWLDPYYDKESGPNESKLLQSANALATTLEMDDIVVYQGLK